MYIYKGTSRDTQNGLELRAAHFRNFGKLNKNNVGVIGAVSDHPKAGRRFGRTRTWGDWCSLGSLKRDDWRRFGSRMRGDWCRLGSRTTESLVPVWDHESGVISAVSGHKIGVRSTVSDLKGGAIKAVPDQE